MCGRTAQTHVAVRSAATILSPANGDLLGGDGTGAAPTDAAHRPDAQEDGDDAVDMNRDNFNLAPGMDAIVFWKEQNEVKWGRKFWGLVSRGGSATMPLEPGMSKHFANLMFNARSDTLFDKPTFSALASSGRSCVVAVDGFFEWKTEMGKKQPYFVYRKQQTNNSRPYLLLAGLYTSVATGWPEEPTLDTFTIVTTEACEPLQWLHSRMPVTIWDDALAMAWLDKPTAAVHRQLELGAKQTATNVLQWHAVTTEMASMKFRTADAIKALPKMKTVKSFFSSPSKATTNRGTETASASKTSTSSTTTDDSTTSGKRKAPDSNKVTLSSSPAAATTTTAAASQPKKAKSTPTRSIDTFFQRKTKK